MSKPKGGSLAKIWDNQNNREIDAEGFSLAELTSVGIKFANLPSNLPVDERRTSIFNKNLNTLKELLKIEVLIEDSNIKFSNLCDEYARKGVTAIDVLECKEYLNRTLSPEYTEKVLKVLEKRDYIKSTNNQIILLECGITNSSRHLSISDVEFAVNLLKEYRSSDSI